MLEVVKVTAPVNPFTLDTPVVKAPIFPFNFCIALKIVSVALIVPAPLV